MNGFQNPYLSPFGVGNYGQLQQPQMAIGQQVTKVSGENGARAYQMGANSSALLLDESGTMVWLCTTDGAGYKTVSAYDIAPHKSEQAVQYDGLENRIRRLEEIVNGYTGNTSATRTEQYAPGGTARTANDEHGANRTEPAAYAEPTRYEQPATETSNGYRQSAWRRSDEGTAGNGGADGR